jgi:ADP-ribose pyrophosphatase
MPRVVGRRVAWASQYMSVLEKEVELGGQRGVETFWSVKTAGYVAVVGITPDGRIPLVRQYRPAVEAQVLELPSGAIDPGEEPLVAAQRELLEETGCHADRLALLGKLHVDSGRFETQQWGFFAEDIEVLGRRPLPDEDLELVFVTPAELRDLIVSGDFNLAAHVAMVAVALLSGRITA